jgi:hypothetical protein
LFLMILIHCVAQGVEDRRIQHMEDPNPTILKRFWRSSVRDMPLLIIVRH